MITVSDTGRSMRKRAAAECRNSSPQHEQHQASQDQRLVGTCAAASGIQQHARTYRR